VWTALREGDGSNPLENAGSTPADKLMYKKKEKYELVGMDSIEPNTKVQVPRGSTHFELEIDYSNCYKPGDLPSYNIRWFERQK
jgi:hypothetical protein